MSSASDATDNAAADDPSMEDILASIRRILKDDDTIAPPEEPAPAESEDEVFLLDQTMLIDAPAARPIAASLAPAFIASLPEPEVEALPPQRHDPDPEPALPTPEATMPLPDWHDEPDGDEPLLAPSAAAAATASLGALVRVVGQQQMPIHRGGGVTLEDMVRDEIRPLVKLWLDEHLAPMVERMVRVEIARVTGGK